MSAAAGPPGGDAEPGEADLETHGADGLAGPAAWEQPGVVVGVTDGGVPAAAAGEIAHARGERFGDLDGCITEMEPHAGGLVADMAGGQPGDAGERLRVQQHEAARDAVGAVVAGAVQQVPGDRPPLVSFGQCRCRVGVACGSRDLGVTRVAACRAPPEEVAGQVAARFAGSEPLVDVGLPTGGQGKLPAAQPPGDPDGSPDIGAGHDLLPVG